MPSTVSQAEFGCLKLSDLQACRSSCTCLQNETLQNKTPIKRCGQSEIAQTDLPYDVAGYGLPFYHRTVLWAA